MDLEIGMKRKLILILLVLFASGCATLTNTPSDPYTKYTEAVKTVAVQLTQAALLTPSITPSMTPQPTGTSTSTPEPTPTVPTPTPTWAFVSSGIIQAPILAYTSNGIPAEAFQQQVDALKASGYQSISLSLLAKALQIGAELPDRPVVFTFDSMSEDCYSQDLPIMQQAGYTGTLFLTAAKLDTPGNLSSSQVQEMIQAGWEIGSSGMYGGDLTANGANLTDEVLNSRQKLEDDFGIPTVLFAYPNGSANDTILDKVITAGYDAAVTYSWYKDSKHSSLNIYLLSRITVADDWTLDEFMNQLPWKPESQESP
jgi:peptidoglycan/xylan/chitin deacetylase (PgdA/CDA1 family)